MELVLLLLYTIIMILGISCPGGIQSLLVNIPTTDTDQHASSSSLDYAVAIN